MKNSIKAALNLDKDVSTLHTMYDSFCHKCSRNILEKEVWIFSGILLRGVICFCKKLCRNIGKGEEAIKGRGNVV